MNLAFRLGVLLVAFLLIVSCGHRKAPTGGEIDTVKPTVAAVIPEPYSDINNGIIEVTFSKPLDRASVYSGDGGVKLYPQVNDKKYRWIDNTLRIEINEELIEESNYYLTLSQNIKDLRGNSLDKDYLYIFSTGKLANNKIGGYIFTELEEDFGEEVTINVLSADSVYILTQKQSGNRFNIEYLNEQPHLIRAYIDKNLNNRYDSGQEPYFEAIVPQGKFENIDLSLEYVDKTKPEVRSANANFKNLLTIQMNKAIESFEEIRIATADSLEAALQITDYGFLDDKIEVVTHPMDTLSYKLVLKNVKDKKNNIAEELEIDFKATDKADSSSLEIVEYTPRNGAVVETLKPSLKVVFSKFVFQEAIFFKLEDTMLQEDIEALIYRVDSRTFFIVPKEDLISRQTYRLTVFDTTKDASNNTMTEPLEIDFLPIVHQKQ